MKTFTLLFLSFFSLALFAQNTTLPVNFEEGTYAFTDFDGGITQVVTNPDASGINTSANVAEHVRDGGEFWAGTYMILESALDFTNNNTFTIKVYSPAVDIPVLFKLEGDDPADNTELTLNTTVAGEWEELSFNFGDQPSDLYTKIVLIFNMGVVGDGSANSTYYFDDIVFTFEQTLDPMDLPLTFEDENVNYVLTDFGGNSSSIGEDPEDASNTVAISVKGDGAETWAGTTMGTNDGFPTNIPFAENETKIHLSIYSPATDLPIRLKVEDSTDPTVSVETEAVTTVANAWEILVFDFSNEAPGTATLDLSSNYNKASIFFDFGSMGTGATYYWDNVTFGDAPSSIQTVETAAMNVYPNPASDMLTVSAKYDVESVSVFSVHGKQQTVKQLANNRMDISHLSAGIYTLHITDIQGNQAVSKFVKM